MNSKNLKISIILIISVIALCLFKLKLTITSENIGLTDQTLNANQSEFKIRAFLDSIKEQKIYSQNQEDGVILSLISLLKLPKNNGTFVEFGTENGLECNTRYLREELKWTGLLMDGSNENLNWNLHREKILYSNIIQLFKKYKIDQNIDIFSEDTDYADYWIVDKVVKTYRPKIVIHEVNQQPPNLCVTVPRPKPLELIFWENGSSFHGGSVCAFYCLAKKNGYTMVYCESSGVNCFWVRNDLLESVVGVNVKFIQKFLNPNFLYRKARFVYRPTSNKWQDINC